MAGSAMISLWDARTAAAAHGLIMWVECPLERYAIHVGVTGKDGQTTR